MKEKKLFINLFIILFSIGVVFFFRMESRKTSYAVQKKYRTLKEKRSTYRRSIASYKFKTGENLYENKEKMIAFKAVKSKQLVMIDGEMMVSE